MSAIILISIFGLVALLTAGVYAYKEYKEWEDMVRGFSIFIPFVFYACVATLVFALIIYGLQHIFGIYYPLVLMGVVLGILGLYLLVVKIYKIIFESDEP